MHIGDLGPNELAVIAVVVLLIVGGILLANSPRRIPKDAQEHFKDE